MTEVVGVAIENWTAESYGAAIDWLFDTYGGISNGVTREITWYIDHQPLCSDLVMRKDIYFMFTAAFGEDYGTTC